MPFRGVYFGLVLVFLVDCMLCGSCSWHSSSSLQSMGNVFRALWCEPKHNREICFKIFLVKHQDRDTQRNLEDLRLES